MSAQVTEAHVALAEKIICSGESINQWAVDTAQLIADSEAAVCADLRQQIANLTYSNSSHRETAEAWRKAAIERDKLRDELAKSREKVRVLRETLIRRHDEQSYHAQYVDAALAATEDAR